MASSSIQVLVFGEDVGSDFVWSSANEPAVAISLICASKPEQLSIAACTARSPCRKGFLTGDPQIRLSLCHDPDPPIIDLACSRDRGSVRAGLVPAEPGSGADPAVFGTFQLAPVSACRPRPPRRGWGRSGRGRWCASARSARSSPAPGPSARRRPARPRARSATSSSSSSMSAAVVSTSVIGSAATMIHRRPGRSSAIARICVAERSASWRRSAARRSGRRPAPGSSSASG